MDFEEVFGMSLYDNDSYREEFMEEVYKLLADDPDNSRANEIIDLFDNAPEFNPPNDPLTLDQLREMDGEPVWLDAIKRWGIVKVCRDGVFALTKSGEFEVGRCKCYRRPPEGEEDQHGDHRM